jgi:hypothetical protein
MTRTAGQVRRVAGAAVRRWGSAGAADNARCASTDLSRRRLEYEEVESYLRATAARRTA